MRAVNLLPRDETSGRGAGRLDPVVLGGAVLLVAVVGGTAGGYLLEHKHAGSERQQLATSQAQLAAAQARLQHQQSAHAKKLLPTPSVTAQEKPWRDAVASALSTRIAFDRVLNEFERVVPSDVTVSSLSMGAPGAPAASSGGSSTTTTSSAPATSTSGTGGGEFSLTGTTFSVDSVARLLSRLMLVPDLTNVTLSSSTADPGTGIVTFAIAAAVKGGPASSTSTTSSSAFTDTTSTTTTTGASS